jgi:hypothetical protein
VDEQSLAGLEPRLGEERVVGGGENLGRASGARPVERFGNGHGRALVHQAELGLTTTPDDGHHSIPLREALGARTAGGDLPGELEARDVGRRARRSRIATAALEHVGRVQAGGAHAHEQLAGAGLWVGVLVDYDLAGADGGGAHGSAC